MINNPDVSPEKLKGLYLTLPEKVVIKDIPDFSPKFIAACDVSYRKVAYVSCVIWNILDKKVEEEITRKKDIPAEYIPCRFALRELPLIAEVLSEVSLDIDCLIMNGHGIAHPDRAGLACFAGVLFDVPTVGCAKNILVGEYTLPSLKKGEYSDIIYKEKKVGEVVCTRDGTTPIFVSPGHKIGFESSRRLILNLSINSKYPEPLRLADMNAKRSL